MLAFLSGITPPNGSISAKVNGMETPCARMSCWSLEKSLSSASKGFFDPRTKLNRDSSVGSSPQHIVSMRYSVDFPGYWYPVQKDIGPDDCLFWCLDISDGLILVAKCHNLECG